MESIFAAGHRYLRDSHGSFHRTTSRGEYAAVLEFYRTHIYVGSKFWSHDVLSLPIKALSDLADVEIQKAVAPLEFFEAQTSLNPVSANILELGCGCGTFLHVLKDRGYRNVSGIDISALSPPVASRLWGAGLDINVREALFTLSSLPGTSTYDLIVALDIIEHVWHDDALIEEIASSISPGGQLLVEVPIIGERITDSELASYEFLYPEHHLHLYTREGFLAMLEGAGLRVARSEVVRAGKKLYLLAERH